jgi:hypothetical protein
MPPLVVVPRQHLLAGHAEGHGGEEGKARVLVEEVVFGRVVQVGLAGGDGVEHLEGAHERAGGHLVDGQLAVGHLGDDVCGHRGASSKIAKPSGTDVTMVSVRLPWA